MSAVRMGSVLPRYPKRNTGPSNCNRLSSSLRRTMWSLSWHGCAPLAGETGTANQTSPTGGEGCEVDRRDVNIFFFLHFGVTCCQGAHRPLLFGSVFARLGAELPLIPSQWFSVTQKAAKSPSAWRKSNIRYRLSGGFFVGYKSLTPAWLLKLHKCSSVIQLTF